MKKNQECTYVSVKKCKNNERYPFNIVKTVVFQRLKTMIV